MHRGKMFLTDMKTKIILLMSAILSAQLLFACAAITKKGKQCRRSPSPGSIYCWQHGGKAAKEQKQEAAGSAQKRQMQTSQPFAPKSASTNKVDRSTSVTTTMRQ